jgi:guanidinoacetate N-methyltransferase
MSENEETALGYNRLPESSMSETWASSEVDVDSNFLRIEGHAVMERWETPFMHELARVSMLNGGTVLEVGLGMHISAEGIQKYNPTKHFIIELNQAVIDQAAEFLAAHPSVEVLAGDWAEVLDRLPDGSLDGILYDTYPMNKQEQHTHQFEFIRRARSKLRVGGILTYCNLTSLGLLYSQQFAKLGRNVDVSEIWESMWEEFQVPHLLSSGWKREELHYHVFQLPQEAIHARGECEYYSHATCLVPKLTRSE